MSEYLVVCLSEHPIRTNEVACKVGYRRSTTYSRDIVEQGSPVATVKCGLRETSWTESRGLRKVKTGNAWDGWGGHGFKLDLVSLVVVLPPGPSSPTCFPGVTFRAV
jgi:hypothetical protein